MEEASRKKEEGTKEFIRGDHLAAAELYMNAAKLAIHSHPDHSDDEAGLYVKCWGNAALCFVKEKSWNDVIYCCNKVLEKFPNEFQTNIKVVYRRGLANMYIDNWKDAKADLTAAFAIDSTNRDVRVAIQELKDKIVQSNRKERTRFNGIFGKISMYDDKSFNLALVPTAKGDELMGFPDTVLASMAQFLTKTERALVAVAMTASSKAWRESKWRKRPLGASRMMITAMPLGEIEYNHQLMRSYEWDFLDFKDIDKSLAKKLSDDDIGGVLVCIDAINTIKVLKLKGCINVVGHGLEPLRGSRVLEQLDLCPVDNEEGVKSTRDEDRFLFHLLPSLKEAAVVPILDGILDDVRSALRHLSFPKKWRIDKGPLLCQFLDRYNRYLNRRELACSHKPCGSNCRHLNDSQWVPRSGECYGIQQYSCYACRGLVCQEHSNEIPYACEVCELTYCFDCNRTSKCDLCYRTICENCITVCKNSCVISWCGICERDLCDKCCYTYYCDSCDDFKCEDCSSVVFCDRDGCYKKGCIECSADGFIDCNVKNCSVCDVTFCGGHLAHEIYLLGEGRYCGHCNERAISALEQTNEHILRTVHQWEEMHGYQDRFESDLKSENITKLFVEQKRMKQRWEHLYSIATSEQKQGRLSKKYLDEMFIVEV